MEQVNENSKLKSKEIQILRAVLKRYDIFSFSASKVRSIYKITTPTGTFCLKKMRHGRSKVKNGYILVQHLNSENFHYTAKYYKTINDKYYVPMHNHIFYLTEWIDGSECNLSNINEAVSCSKLLANFHNAVNNISIRGMKIGTKFVDWPKILFKAANDLKFYKKTIIKKRIQSEFDNMYLNWIDIYYNRIIKAINLLNSSNYDELLAKAICNHTICHNSFYYQNIIKTVSDYYIIDLDSIVIDIQIVDLMHFIRRLMCKSEYSWDFNKAKVIIESYASVKPISYSEFQIMVAMIVYPHKFMKLGKKYYIKNKHWSNEKYMRKLNRFIKSSDKENLFIDNFMKYID
ncbi:CotS family spore coat protein, partial [Clostridium oryzae]|uniref:CotS family spore coat protein n=1 Tax=Clostridium oryzae TaxID=1450648 RepID=UPI001FA8DFB5